MAISGVPVNIENIINAIHLKKGVISHAAEYLGIDRGTIYSLIKENKDVADAVIKAREDLENSLIDMDQQCRVQATKSMLELLAEKEVSAVIFAMKCKRGWREQRENNNRSIEVNPIKEPWKHDDEVSNSL